MPGKKNMTVSRETRPLSFPGFLDRYEHLFTVDPGVSIEALAPSALLLRLFSLRSKQGHGMVVVLPSVTEAEEIYHLAFNLFPEWSLYFPEREVSGLDVDGFNLENERYRSDVFNAMDEDSYGLIFTTEKGLKTRVRDIRESKYPSFRLSVGAELDRNRLIETISDWGYEQVDKTTSPNTFSVRGGILDLFLLYSPSPVRVEWFGNEVESLRYFNPLSQRQTGTLERLDILVPPGNETTAGKMTSLENICGETVEILNVIKEAGLWTVSGEKDITDASCSSWNPGEDLNFGKADNSSYIFVFNDFIKTPGVDEFSFPENTVYIDSYLENGFISDYFDVAVCSLGEVLRKPSPYHHKWQMDTLSHLPQRTLSKIEDLQWGNLLVHEDFGIGRFRGLTEITSPERVHECIKIEYADDGVVYVPVEKFDKVHQLVENEEKSVSLSRLGTSHWDRQKQRVKASANEAVKELVALYAERNRERGFVYDTNDYLVEKLESSFPFEETPDQKAAIEAVYQDMESSSPMDRLVCGDVGFGKTEVALRAITKAVISGKKALFLTPTTILADQHFISCSSRLKPLGVKLDLLSRFKSKKEQLKTLEEMVRGNLDLVVGTHRLLSEDVVFPDLGLLVVDEEHRFGVRHKEKIKQLKKRVDVLTLTATPIPRTLQHSLMGLRPVSRIDTPPKTRKPIQTFVKFFNWDLINKSIQREIGRGGQVYFLHNEISSLPFLHEKLLKSFPSASVAVAHGQMKSRELESIVLSFFDGNLDILLCTTIVESGLDVSNANTIIINDAHNFGLAQLYQIRGRVGRGHRQAACLLLIPHKFKLSNTAYRRLKAIEQHTMLGSGYDVALKDLEIRGAGNLFGFKQSGHMGAIGFEMYCRILQEAVDETFGIINTSVTPPRVLIDGPALLPGDYVQLVEDRLYFYQRLSEARKKTTVKDVKNEIRDRFGKLPEAAENLVLVSDLRVSLTGSTVTLLHLKHRGFVVHVSGLKDGTSPPSFLSSLTAIFPPWRGTVKLKPGNNESLLVEVEIFDTVETKNAVYQFVKLFSLGDSN